MRGQFDSGIPLSFFSVECPATAGREGFDSPYPLQEVTEICFSTRNITDADDMHELSKHSIRGNLTYKVGELVTVWRRIETAAPLDPFHYKITDIHSPENTTFLEREQHANQLFSIDIVPHTLQYYAFLRRLQSLGFDVYAMLSNPKVGEMASPIHGNIALLQKLLQNPFTERNILQTGFVRNKLRLGGYFNEGRFHMRIYPGVEKHNTIISAHIDPPDLLNHANIFSHLSDRVETDYEGGEKLLITVLAYMGGTPSEEALDSESIIR